MSVGFRRLFIDRETAARMQAENERLHRKRYLRRFRPGKRVRLSDEGRKVFPGSKRFPGPTYGTVIRITRHGLLVVRLEGQKTAPDPWAPEFWVPTKWQPARGSLRAPLGEP